MTMNREEFKEAMDAVRADMRYKRDQGYMTGAPGFFVSPELVLAALEEVAGLNLLFVAMDEKPSAIQNLGLRVIMAMLEEWK